MLKDQVKFDLNSVFHKLYEANGEREVTLTPYEADELFEYLDYVSWLLNRPKKTGLKGKLISWLSK